MAEGKPGPEGSDGGGGSCTMFMDRMGGGGGRAFSEEEGGTEKKTCYLCSDCGGGKRRNVAEVLLPTKKKFGGKTVSLESQKRKQGQDFPLSGAKLVGSEEKVSRDLVFRKNKKKSFLGD